MYVNKTSDANDVRASASQVPVQVQVRCRCRYLQSPRASSMSSHVINNDVASPVLTRAYSKTKVLCIVFSRVTVEIITTLGFVVITKIAYILSISYTMCIVVVTFRTSIVIFLRCEINILKNIFFNVCIDLCGAQSGSFSQTLRRGSRDTRRCTLHGCLHPSYSLSQIY